jgi:hypothetical protein
MTNAKVVAAMEASMNFFMFFGLVFVICAKRPNDPSSATRPAGRNDCNLDAMAGFAAAHG